MEILILLVGISVLLATVADLAFTTFSSNGAGLLTNIITKSTWSLALRLARRDGSKKFLEYIGIVAIGQIVISWLLLIWLGSSLIFCSVENSVVHSITSEAANTHEKFYFAGFTLSTLGVGDYVPGTNFWRYFTVILSLSGFMLITTAISYMLPVLSADVFKKKLSTYVNMLGNNPQEILLNHWDGKSFASLEEEFASLKEVIIMHSQQLLAYPILYCFHNSERPKSSTINIAIMDEVLTILEIYIPEAQRPRKHAMLGLRKAIDNYIEIQSNNFIDLSEDSSDMQCPDLTALEMAGIPLADDKNVNDERYRKLMVRRGQINYLLENEGRSFTDIYVLYTK